MKPANVVVCGNHAVFLGPFPSLMNGAFRLYPVQTASELHKALEESSRPDLVILQVPFADIDAAEFCHQLKGTPDLCMIPVLLVSTEPETLPQQIALDTGCDDLLVDPIDPSVLAVRAQSLLRLKFLADAREDVDTVLFTLARTIEAKDQYTQGHAERVGRYAEELGRSLGLSSREQSLLRKGGMLHDIGKIGIPDSILLKPGRYSADEYDVMKRHPMLGCEICKKLKTVHEALPMIRHHHEKLDGSGYPDGLRDDEIPPLVRAVSIVDIYDALRSRRSYKEAYPIDRSLEILWEEAEKGWWDKDILSCWEKVVRSGSIEH